MLLFLEKQPDASKKPKHIIVLQLNYQNNPKYIYIYLVIFTNKIPIVKSNNKLTILPQCHRHWTYPVQGDALEQRGKDHRNIHNVFLQKFIVAGKEAAIIPHYVGWRDSPAAPKRINKLVLSVNPWDPSEVLAWVWVLCEASLCLSCGSWGFQLQVRSSDWLFWERRYLSYRERMKNWSLDPMTSPVRLWAPEHKGA